jgi:transposase
MTKKTRRKFDAVFKSEAVKLCKAGGRSIAQIAKDINVVERSLREWVRQADDIAALGPAAPAIAEERRELLELRKRVKRLEMEREILKKAAAFFAKENA